jgi:protein required for attachment to host cells
MRTTWILVGDASRARIFEIAGAGRPMREVRDFFNPEGRTQNRGLATDAQGRFRGKGEHSQGHSAPEGTSPAEHDEEMFAVELTDYVDNARAQGLFQALHLIAPPKLLGMLRRHLKDTTRKLVGKEIDKDLSRSAPKDIEDYVRGNPALELEGARVTNVPKR